MSTKVTNSLNKCACNPYIVSVVETKQENRHIYFNKSLTQYLKVTLVSDLCHNNPTSCFFKQIFFVLLSIHFKYLI